MGAPTLVASTSIGSELASAASRTFKAGRLVESFVLRSGRGRSCGRAASDLLHCAERRRLPRVALCRRRVPSSPSPTRRAHASTGRGTSSSSRPAPGPTSLAITSDSNRLRSSAHVTCQASCDAYVASLIAVVRDDRLDANAATSSSTREHRSGAIHPAQARGQSGAGRRVSRLRRHQADSPRERAPSAHDKH